MNKHERAFTATVWQFYDQHGRHTLPWRHTTDPYKILVSEMMLQQTQVDRVLSKYQHFLEQFPQVSALAVAPLASVLRQWQGLGYNRRARFLHETAKRLVQESEGVFPKCREALMTLPGIGPYTAAAVTVFAYNAPVCLVETNVRQVYLHHFFKTDALVSDEDILALVKKTLPEENFREWFWALMDYGSTLKRQYGNRNVQSKQYTKQTVFKDSNRQIRGLIIKTLSVGGGQTVHSIQKQLPTHVQSRVRAQLQALTTEGLISSSKHKYYLG